MSVDISCGCKNTTESCPMPATQEDLLCDFCAGRRSMNGPGGLSCLTVAKMIGQPASFGDHLINAKRLGYVS